MPSMPTQATDPTKPIDVTPVHDFAAGDQVVYTGTAGEHRGVVAEVRELADSTGMRLRAFLLHIPGVGALLTSGDALRPEKRTQPASIEIPREKYTDPTVPAATDARVVERADTPSFDEPGDTGRHAAEPLGDKPAPASGTERP